MAVLFIADLHLSAAEPAITTGFLHFLSAEATEAEALYILGDLFDSWVGDDDPAPLHHAVAKALQQLHQQGVKLYFIHGNRDFLLGKAFARQSSLTLLPTETLITLYDKKVLIMHGDTLCSDDHRYQRYRCLVHNQLIQRVFLCLPLTLRLGIARQLRKQSSSSQQYKADISMDVNLDTVAHRLRHYGADLLIHGHTHRPAIHQLVIAAKEKKTEKKVQRIVLGDWHYNQGSMLKVTPQGEELIYFPLSVQGC